MKVLKFGGSSVGSPEALTNVKQIIESRRGNIIVVVSALGGITDALLQASSTAAAGDISYKSILEAISKRHFEVVSSIGLDAQTKADLDASLQTMLDELSTLCAGVFTLKVLPEKTNCQIVSFGERMSSLIVSALIKDAILVDALDFIRTRHYAGKTILDSAATEPLLRKAFESGEAAVRIVPGFISRDSESGEITNLGRGGSDYTASIIAAVLNAEILEIWTDVDGFMTADPRIIKTSYVIDELSFADAMELCNFGAKVIYPPSLYPVRDKDIPIIIKNTFNPSCKGSVIKRKCHNPRTVTGISSIHDTCILTVSGSSMAGIIGVDSRIFTALARENISVFLVSQSSSETNISLGVKEEDADLARELLNREFSHEIAEGSMSEVELLKDLSTVAIVGVNMKGNAGIAGKLFSVLGRNGISIVACAQGTEERNISFVVARQYLRKSLNVIHDSFFLSAYQELNLFICGVGTVGSQLLEQISSQREKLKKERNLKLNLVGIIRRKAALFNRDGIDPATYKEKLLSEGISSVDLDVIRNEVIGMNIFNSVFVDCTASDGIATLYKDFLEHGISVVAANKVAASSGYDNYQALKTTARNRGAKFLFETNVGAGLPIINTINALVNSGDKIQKIEAVLSGTLNFICNTISADIPFSRTVRMAKEQGYSEPDPRIDLSGKDVVRKLVILAREAGYKVEQNDVESELFIPSDFFTCSEEEFWAKLPTLDEGFEKERRRLAEEHKHWRFVARMEGGRYSVSLREFEETHPFYQLEGSNNIILLTTERYHQHPMLIQGYGAGASVTAAGVFADIMSIANI